MEELVYTTVLTRCGRSSYVGFPIKKSVTYNEKGEAIVPAGCSLTPPPEKTGKHQSQVINMLTGKWSLIEDYRGVEFWMPDGSSGVVKSLGTKIPSDAITTPPPSRFHTSHDGNEWIKDDSLFTYELSSAYSGALAAIDDKAKQSIESEFESEAMGTAFYYDCRYVDQINLSRRISLAIEGELVHYLCRHPDSDEYDLMLHTREQLIAVQRDMDNHIESHRMIARDKKSMAANMLANRDLEGLLAIDIDDWSASDA